MRRMSDAFINRRKRRIHGWPLVRLQRLVLLSKMPLERYGRHSESSHSQLGFSTATSQPSGVAIFDVDAKETGAAIGGLEPAFVQLHSRTERSQEIAVGYHYHETVHHVLPRSCVPSAIIFAFETVHAFHRQRRRLFDSRFIGFAIGHFGTTFAEYDGDLREAYSGMSDMQGQRIHLRIMHGFHGVVLFRRFRQCLSIVLSLIPQNLLRTK